MPATLISIRQGYTSRYLITATDANGAPLDITSYTINIIVKAASRAATAALTFSLVGSTGVSTPEGRLYLGRPDPVDIDGPLIDTDATSGYITMRFAPEDTATLVTTAAKSFVWEAQAVGASDTYFLDAGVLKVDDSYFLPVPL